MKPLYLTNSYLKEWNAKVESANGKLLTLDESAFYPAGGGQPCDFGEISCNGDAYKVLNVTKKDGIETDREGLQAGDEVRCTLDWERRYRLMRMHTTAHILISAMYSRENVFVTGNQLDTEKSRIDFSLENFDRQKMEKCFEIANEIVMRDLPVSFTFMKRDEVLKMPHLAKLAAGLPDIQEFRILRIGDVDEQADGGTHVRSTKEIGAIRLLSVDNKGKSNRRVYYMVE